MTRISTCAKGSEADNIDVRLPPVSNSNSETCTFSNPAAADYYVMLRGYQTFSGVRLIGHYP